MSTSVQPESGEGGEKKKNVCQELDKTLLEFFSTLTQLYQEQSRLQQAMKSGFINMSRARYSMGINSVGAQQIDENKMRASTKVVIDDNEMFCLYDSPNTECNIDNCDSKDQISSAQSGLRQRKPKANTDEGFELVEKIEDIELEDAEESSNSKMKGDTSKAYDKKLYDPLRWFGILVPAALRQSQKDFRGSSEIVVSIANLQNRLAVLQDKYASLLKQKSCLIE